MNHPESNHPSGLSAECLAKICDDALWTPIVDDLPEESILSESDVDELARIDRENRPAVLSLTDAARILHEPLQVTLAELRQAKGLRCRNS